MVCNGDVLTCKPPRFFSLLPANRNRNCRRKHKHRAKKKGKEKTEHTISKRKNLLFLRQYYVVLFFSFCSKLSSSQYIPYNMRNICIMCLLSILVPPSTTSLFVNINVNIRNLVVVARGKQREGNSERPNPDMNECECDGRAGTVVLLKSISFEPSFSYAQKPAGDQYYM